MSRLPSVGGDLNAWGDVLNDFLTTSHNADGTLKSSAVNAAKTGILTVVNVKTDYGAKGDGTTDDSAAINAAVTAAAAAGGGIVYAPAGTYKISGTSIALTSKVSIIGAGIGRTIFKPYGAFQCFLHLGGLGDVTSDVLLADFEIDGSNHANGGVYTSAMKGIQVTYALRHVYRNLYVHHCGATGIGSDYMVDSFYDSCISDNNGRLNAGTDAGGAGFGVGTGAYAIENLVIRNCISRNNGTNGVFFANQSGVQSKGSQLINHYSSGNGVHGIADAGVNGLQVIGGISTANTKCGFAGYKGTYAGESGPGINALIRGLDTYANTLHGVHLDCVNNPANGYVLDGVKSHDNLGHGVFLDVGAAAVTGFHLRNSEVYNNRSCGLIIGSTGGSVTDAVIENNNFNGNGVNTGLAANLRAGIRIATSITQLRLRGNRCWDNQGTKTQTYGLYIDAVTITGGGVLDGNDLAQNLTGGTNISATWSSVRIGMDNDLWTTNTGAPTFSAPVGTMYKRLDGAAGTRIYVNQDGATTWAAIAGV